jgi:hypothetical protein
MLAETLTPDPLAVVDAAYGLALAVTGDEEQAAASVIAAARGGRRTPGRFVRAVREEARARRPASGSREAEPLPSPAASVAPDDWAVLERVAMRGMRLGEAAEALGIDRADALLRLHRGLAAAGAELRGARARVATSPAGSAGGGGRAGGARTSSAAVASDGEGQARRDAEPARGHRFGLDRPARDDDDAARDRQPEAAAGAGVAL